jgi:hypothetical protein
MQGYIIVVYRVSISATSSMPNVTFYENFVRRKRHWTPTDPFLLLFYNQDFSQKRRKSGGDRRSLFHSGIAVRRFMLPGTEFAYH